MLREAATPRYLKGNATMLVRRSRVDVWNEAAGDAHAPLRALLHRRVADRGLGYERVEVNAPYREEGFCK